MSISKNQTAASKKAALQNYMKKKPVRVTLKTLKTAFKCILTIILIGMITACIVGCVLVVYVVTSFDGKDIPDLKTINQNESSRIYVKDASGEFVEAQRVEGENRVWKGLNDIPMNMQNAVIAIEDQRFREHYGVDWKRTVSAFANLVFHFSSKEYGGSTITQQLIKNISKDDDVKISRKIREILRAIEMERTGYTKDDIMEAYLNILPLSGNTVGVGAAANYYFAKDVKDLTLAECALIAGITQNPSKYNPYQHPDNVKQRQKVVLTKMYSLGMITEDEYKQAYNQELVYTSNVRNAGTQDYYTDVLTEDVINGLMETYGYSKEYATSMYYFGGLNIYSAEDKSLQSKVEEIFENDDNFPKPNKYDNENPQSGIAIMDYSGRMIATVGGRGKKEANRIFNRATDATRQPGSAMKPIAVYAPAIEMNIITYSTLIQNEPIIMNGKEWPYNYTKSDRGGSVPVVDALKKSLNTVPVRIIQDLTPKKSFEFLTNSLHMTTLVKARSVNNEVKTDIVPSLALGGLTDGVKCIEMAAAYQVFGNGGVYNEPYTFYEVKRGDKVLLENKPTNVQVIGEDTAYVMNQLLQRVIDDGGTGRGQGIGNFTTFGKTGTTDDNKDVYFVGGTPYYVGACWFGYDDNETIRSGETGYAKKLWKKSMDALHSGLSEKTFDKTGGVVQSRFDSATGRTDPNGNRVGYYKPNNIPGNITTDSKPDETKETTAVTTQPSQSETTAGQQTTTQPTTKPSSQTKTTTSSAKQDGDDIQQPAA